MVQEVEQTYKEMEAMYMKFSKKTIIAMVMEADCIITRLTGHHFPSEEFIKMLEDNETNNKNAQNNS